MKILKRGNEWYGLTGHVSGISASFRHFGRGEWGLTFHNPDNSRAFGMKPGSEIRVRGKANCIDVAIVILNRGHI